MMKSCTSKCLGAREETINEGVRPSAEFEQGNVIPFALRHPLKDHFKDERDYAYLKFFDEKLKLQQEVKHLIADVKLRSQMKQDLVNKFKHHGLTAERNRGDYEQQSKLLERQLKETKEQTGQLVEEIEKYRELITQRNKDVDRYEAAQSKPKEQTKPQTTTPRKMRDVREAIFQP